MWRFFSKYMAIFVRKSCYLRNETVSIMCNNCRNVNMCVDTRITNKMERRQVYHIFWFYRMDEHHIGRADNKENKKTQTFTTSPMMAVGTPFCIPFGNNTLGLMRSSFKPVFWFHQHTNGAKFKRRGSSFVLPYINVNTFLRLHWWFFRGHIRFPPKGAFIQLLLLRGVSSTLQLDVSTLHFPSVLSSNFTPEFGKRNDVPKVKDSYFVIQCLQDTTIDNKIPLVS